MKINRDNLGFSLIELIVSISIITLLATLFLANYHTVNQRTDLTMTSQVMVTDIRMAQSNALGLIQYDGATPSGGWGISLSSHTDENNKYTLFADADESQDSSSDETIVQFGAKIIDLPSNITIDSLVTQGGEVVESANIIFLPPDPLTYIVTNMGTTTAIEIRLKEDVNNTIKTVRVNFLGLVEVID